MSESLDAWIINHRRYLHTIPEVAHNEHRTRRYISQRLTELGIEQTTITGKDVVGTIHGTSPGQTVVVRADMDGLAVTEDTGLDFAAETGTMHACGHDGHMAIVLGVAKLFSQLDQFPGEVRFLFQHAEEALPGGASQIVEAGGIRDVDAVLGCHLWQPLPTGMIGVRSGAAMGGCDEFTINLSGVGGHGSAPQSTVDPTLMAAHFITQVHTIVSRSLDPLEQAVVSVGKVEAGTTYNVIPENARISGTVRHFDIEVSAHVETRMHEILRGVTQSFGGSYQLDYIYGEPPLVNDPETMAVVESAAKTVIGDNHVVRVAPTLASEDFTHYSQCAPSAFIFVGVGSKERTAAQHAPQFDIAEEMLKPASHVLFTATRDLLTSRQN